METETCPLMSSLQYYGNEREMDLTKTQREKKSRACSPVSILVLLRGKTPKRSIGERALSVWRKGMACQIFLCVVLRRAARHDTILRAYLSCLLHGIRAMFMQLDRASTQKSKNCYERLEVTICPVSDILHQRPLRRRKCTVKLLCKFCQSLKSLVKQSSQWSHS